MQILHLKSWEIFTFLAREREAISSTLMSALKTAGHQARLTDVCYAPFVSSAGARQHAQPSLTDIGPFGIRGRRSISGRRHRLLQCATYHDAQGL